MPKPEKLVPKLRFPEFEGEWENVKFGALYVFLSTNSLSREQMNFDKGDVQNIHYGDIHTRYNALLDVRYELIPFINSDIDITKFADDKLLKTGDIVIADASEDYDDIGKAVEIINVDDQKIVAGLHTLHARIKVFNSVANGFMAFCLMSPNFRSRVKIIAQGTKVLGLSSSRYSKLPTPIPTLPEQRKIADFLSDVDRRIQLLQKKKQHLETYKKGVMQQIFSQKIRFKDENGHDFPEWEEKKLGEVTYKVGKKNKQGLDLPVYSINNKTGFIPQSEQFDGIDSNARGFDTTMYKIVERETFAYNPARINVGSIGYSYGLTNVIISSLYVCFKTYNNLLDIYLLHYLNTNSFNKAVLRNVEGGVREYLFFENFSKIKIPLPSLPEQRKIAEFLSAIDTQIESVSKQIEHSQSFKKGLLQQMFV